MIAVFLDRDGTIGGDGGGIHPFEFELYEYAAQSIRILNNAGIKVLLFTNQSWIGMGKFSEEIFLKGFELMKKQLEDQHAFLDGLYYCPHKPEDGCLCRKPKTTLLFEAQKEFGLDFSHCYVVGDRLSDLVAAENIGSKKILVKTGRGEKTLVTHNKKASEKLRIDFIADDVLSAAEWIVKDVCSI